MTPLEDEMKIFVEYDGHEQIATVVDSHRFVLKILNRSSTDLLTWRRTKNILLSFGYVIHNQKRTCDGYCAMLSRNPLINKSG